ncbi:MAG: phosphate ABC transporter substrate-binding protein PstS [Elainellaceae cyanobacterium]
MNRRLFPHWFFGAIALIALWVVACQSPSSVTDNSANPSEPAAIVRLNGTGASFPFFIYQHWFSEYNQLHPNVQVNYQPTGSEVGVQQMISGTIDFGASDVAMREADMAAVEQGIVLLPMTAGSVAIAYNLPGIDSGLKLTRAVYPAIFAGEIANWSDPQIAAANPDLTLPDLPIILVHRSDGSGTTAALTNHLSAISPTWKETVGAGVSVSWPAGVAIKSNAGVSAQIQQAAGAIGYVELSYAQQLGMTVAALENQAGEFVLPGVASTASALSTVELPDSLVAFVPDPEEAESYPISTYTWIMAYQQYDDPAKGATLRELLQWCATEGQAYSEELGYVPLSEEVANRVVAAIAQIQ